MQRTRDSGPLTESTNDKKIRGSGPSTGNVSGAGSQERNAGNPTPVLQILPVLPLTSSLVAEGAGGSGRSPYIRRAMP